jgi:hypothetical protein
LIFPFPSTTWDPQIPQTTVTVPYVAAQTAENLKVVVVGWNDSTAQVTSVGDSMGNNYFVAVGPILQTGLSTQTIYYAKSTFPGAANANLVTVTFTGAALTCPYARLNSLPASLGRRGSADRHVPKL